MTSQSGKVAMVTGASTGIGRVICHTLAARGHHLVMTGLCTEQEATTLVDEFKSKYPGDFHFLHADLKFTEQTEKLGSDALALYPQGIDIFVSNAGVPLRGPVETLDVGQWQSSLTINLTAPFILIKAFLPLMKEKAWGRIVVMSSQMGLIGEVEKSNYCTVKAGLLGMCRAVALEAAEFGVTVNPVCPGFVDAPMCHSQITKIAGAQGISFEQAKEEFAASKSPMKKLIPIQEVADLVAFLCSDHVTCMSGHPVTIDGSFCVR